MKETPAWIVVRADGMLCRMRWTAEDVRSGVQDAHQNHETCTQIGWECFEYDETDSMTGFQERNGGRRWKNVT